MAIIKPVVTSSRFSSTIASGTGTGATFAIAATDFTDDAGAAATAFPSSISYYNLYLNGMIQQTNTSSVTTTTITIPDADVLDPTTPVIVEFIAT